MTLRRSLILVMELAAISVAVWGIGKTYVKLSQSDTPVFLITTPANSYSRGTPVPITATLGLPASTLFPTTLKVSTLGQTTIRVISVMRDGVKIESVHGVPDFITDPQLLQDSYIREITSGDAVAIPGAIIADVDGIDLLMDISMRGAHCKFFRNPITGETRSEEVPAYDTHIYKLDAPGVYVIQLSYQYSGWSPAVFKNFLVSNKLTIEIK